MDPSDAVLLSQLRAIFEQNAPEFRQYYAHEDATCRQALTALFGRQSTPIRWLIPLAEAQVRTRHRLDEEAPIDARLLAALADDPLCLLLLSESLNTKVTFERVYKALRRACLHGLPIVPALQPLMSALALQAWNNEYLWEESAEETEEVAAQTTKIDAASAGGDLTPVVLPLLRWAMYRPLATLPAAEAFVAQPLVSIPPVLRPLWQRTLLAPREEAALRAALPTFEQITDPTSRAVRAQYEENPYPRWLRLTGAQKSVLECNRAHDPSFAWPATFRNPLQILVAGCGTGRHPLSLAVANPDAEVLALDLSTTSLAYAQRMARELGIDNIRFVQGDLLQLPAWGRQFHHIDCTGVLHHVRDQQAAWQSVTAVLHPGGTMDVGVYSKVARLPVTYLRARIAREGVPSTPAAMRAFRAQLLREPESVAILGQLIRGYDFFSLSMFRDLLFHVHEHRYTIAGLEQHATACGLRLLAYRLPPRLRRRVALPSGPPTFTQWGTLEMDYTGSLGMFFCTFYRPIGQVSRSIIGRLSENAAAEIGALAALSHPSGG
jgi:ubiquinone/menaquinone biosynthesis C-methylase UbiE